MTMILQEDKLIHVMTVIESTVHLLKQIYDDDDTMNKQIEAGIAFLQKLCVDDPVEEYSPILFLFTQPSKKISANEFMS